MYRIIGGDGREYGPVSAEQLRQWIAQNRAMATTRVLPEGASAWTTLGALPEFSILFATAAARPGVSPAIPAANLVPKSSGFAVTGLVLGIFSLTVGLCCCYGVPFNFLGLVFSIIGLSQINRDPQRYGGKGMAVAGLVLSIISLFIALLFLLFMGASAGWDQMRQHHVYRL